MTATFYRRNLPHIFPENVPIFFTWRLYGSLPSVKAAAALRDEKSGERFKRVDGLLDRAATGPKWLSDARVADCVAEEIECGDDPYHRYDLLEYVVMPNHVHMLVLPRMDAATLMEITKGTAARRANEILGRHGKPFWQRESFDRYCRSVEEVRKIREYIAMNPVKCGLVTRPQDWKWSSLYRRLQKKRASMVERWVPPSP